MRPRLQLASLEETLRYGRPELLRRGLLPRIAGAAGPPPFSLVGAVGPVATGGVNTAFAPSWDGGAGRGKNNLLVCLVVGSGTTTGTPSLSAPWKWSGGNVSAGSQAALGVALATGADAAPTIGAVATMSYSAMLLEFSGNLPDPNFTLATISSMVDQVKGASGIVSPNAATATGVDQQSGSLVVYAWSGTYSLATTGGPSCSLNNGATAHDTSSGTGSSTAKYVMGWGITTSNAAADAATFTFPTTNISSSFGFVASFKRQGMSVFTTSSLNGLTAGPPGVV